MHNTFGKLQQQRARTRGVTLIELIIAVAVVAILAAIAFPSYQEQVRKTRRADGKAELMETAQQLERCYTRFSRYNDGNCGVALPFNSSENYYVVSATVITASAFTLDATPQGAQANDTRCGVLRLTSTGLQGSQGQSTDANECW
jgi:type IV pilus assembly protein PilE